MKLVHTSDGKLARFGAALQGIAAGDFRAPVQQAAMTAVQGLLAEQFAMGIDPNGNPWAPTVRGNAPPLTRSGAMRSSARAVPGPDGLGASAQVTDEKALWHQFGTKRGAPSPGALPSEKARRGRGWKGRRDVPRKTAATPERWHTPPRPMLPIGQRPARWVERIERTVSAAFTAYLRARLGV